MRIICTLSCSCTHGFCRYFNDCIAQERSQHPGDEISLVSQTPAATTQPLSLRLQSAERSNSRSSMLPTALRHETYPQLSAGEQYSAMPGGHPRARYFSPPSEARQENTIASSSRAGTEPFQHAGGALNPPSQSSTAHDSVMLPCTSRDSSSRLSVSNLVQ